MEIYLLVVSDALERSIDCIDPRPVCFGVQRAVLNHPSIPHYPFRELGALGAG